VKTIAFFDFDGTIIKGDSMLLFTRECCGRWDVMIGLIAILPKLISIKLGSNKFFGLKEKFFKHTIKGKKRSELEQCGESISPKLEDNIWPLIKDRLQWHIDKKHEVIIVSASAEIWLKTWAEQNGFGLISSKLEFKEDIFSGKLSTPNCKGEEKVRRIQESYNLSEYDEIYAYGDTRSDIPMLKLADHPYWISRGKMSPFSI